jgi:hypothetical protein
MLTFLDTSPLTRVYHMPAADALAKRGYTRLGPYLFRTVRQSNIGAQKSAPTPKDERAFRSCNGSQATCDLATTILRHGFRTTMASSDARMFAPAAIRNTLSQLPDDCCM